MFNILNKSILFTKKKQKKLKIKKRKNITLISIGNKLL